MNNPLQHKTDFANNVTIIFKILPQLFDKKSTENNSLTSRDLIVFFSIFFTKEMQASHNTKSRKLYFQHKNI